MAVYAIGDIQGCLDDLLRLLEKLRFDPSQDTLWLAGDIVNRGNQSLQTLRFIRSLKKSAITVLGNHDMHLLAVGYGIQQSKRKDTLGSFQRAHDKDKLLKWLRKRPLFHHDKALNISLVHAGLPPQWSIKRAKKCAKEAQKVLRGDQYKDFLQVMYGDMPNYWDNKKLTGMDRIRFIINAFTRLRYCSQDGKMDFSYKLAPNNNEPSHLMPWYNVPERRSSEDRIIFGHWSTLGYAVNNNTFAIDTGCVWGGKLTALRIDTNPPEAISIDCTSKLQPH